MRQQQQSQLSAGLCLCACTLVPTFTLFHQHGCRHGTFEATLLQSSCILIINDKNGKTFKHTFPSFPHYCQAAAVVAAIEQVVKGGQHSEKTAGYLFPKSSSSPSSSIQPFISLFPTAASLYIPVSITPNKLSPILVAERGRTDNGRETMD